MMSPRAGPVPLPLTAISGRRRWALRSAIGITAMAAVAHVSASPGVVKAYADSNLDETPKIEADLLWFLSAVTFTSIPVALWWSTRVQAPVARPLQAYAGALIGGFAVVSVPVSLIAHGPSGLVKVPQVFASSVITALIFAGRTPSDGPDGSRGST